MKPHEQIRALADSLGVPVIIDPVDQQEAARLLDLSYAYVRKRRHRDPDWFPQPRRMFGHYPLWERHQVLEHRDAEAGG